MCHRSHTNFKTAYDFLLDFLIFIPWFKSGFKSILRVTASM